MSQLDPNSPPLWDYVYYTDYQVPSAAVLQHVNTWVSVLKRLTTPFKLHDSSRFEEDTPLEALPTAELERLVPAIDWNNASHTLQCRITDWLANPNERSVVVVVLPPFIEQQTLLSAWASQQGWDIIQPPSPEQILAGDLSWLEQLKANQKPWVLPALEDCYLRHPQGLKLVRHFLNAAYSGDYGQGLIGCDSWAWMFLRYVWQGRTPITLTLQAFDAAKITHYLEHSFKQQHLKLREAKTQQWVIKPSTKTNAETEQEDKEEDKVSAFLAHLTAYSRGNIGVALSLLRCSLRDEPDQSDTSVEAHDDTFWVQPWFELQWPTLPTNASHAEAMILHTLLLHAGLDFKLLTQLVPLPPTQISSILVLLEQYDLVQRTAKEFWYVTPQGYPQIRLFLQNLNYAVDTF
ncbi:MAG: hypothetical protein WAQ53_14775 [Thiofilum sp.]|uniref:hypothetical protein n=1 Tax=Thiofilum sp. TaxID=2212733 RepID=UPI0025E636C7|nr:hypothetical protein [Thiofilum sp.]MBK8453524.1 hypothetical protein [Thiofilum sp.]